MIRPRSFKLLLPVVIGLAVGCTHIPPEVAAQFEPEQDPARNHYLVDASEDTVRAAARSQ